MADIRLVTRWIFLMTAFMAWELQASAIENVVNSTYNTIDPTDASVANWDTGWAQPSVEPTGYSYTTGWNYVGKVNGASGTYLGDGWVVSAAHVGAGDLILGGVTYSYVAHSAKTIGTVDLVFFQVSPLPALPPLILKSGDPTAYRSAVVILGFGDGGSEVNETWGENLVTQIDESITPDGTGYVSEDFLTLTGTSSDGVSPATNNYQVVVGDSGGGAFIYNSQTRNWELAGINEVTGTVTFSNGSTQNFSGFVQIDTYLGDIDAIVSPTDTPVLPIWAITILGGTLLYVGAAFLRKDGARDFSIVLHGLKRKERNRCRSRSHHETTTRKAY